MVHPFDSGFDVRVHPWGRALTCRALPFDHVFTTRDVDVGGEPGASVRGWAAVGESLGLGADRLSRARQVHAAGVHVVRAGGPAPVEIPDADILISNDVSRAVTVRVADCVPLLIGDPALGVVAAAHAGWRGTAAGVAPVAVDRLSEEFGSRAANLIVAIGPCIGPDVYEVGDSVRDAFGAAGFDAREIGRWFPERDGRPPHLDLWQANIDQLTSAGVRPSNIHCLRGCTRSHPDWFFSYRGEGERAGRLVAGIRAGAV